MQRDSSTTRIIQVGMMAALVFVGTYIRITIPTPLGPTMLHLGNVCCILAGLLFGAVPGGLAAGIGSAIFDLLDPQFAAEFWITFILKFFYGFLVGAVMGRGEGRVHAIISAVIGALSYTALYTLKNFLMLHFVLGNPMEAVLPVLGMKALVSLSNAVVAVIVAIILYEVLGKRLRAIL